MSAADGTVRREPPSRMAMVILLWSVAVLALFLWRFPVPVALSRALEVLRALLTAGFMLATAALLGRLLLRVGGLDRILPGPGERLLFAAALGYGVTGLGTFGVSLLGGLHPIPWMGAAAALWGLARRDRRRLGEELREWWVGRPRTRDATGLLLRVALGLAMALMLLESLAPPTAYDALRYHLRLPQIYAAAGRWTEVPYDFNGFFPQNVDMLFTVAFTLGAPAAAGLTHLLLGWLAAGTVALLAVRASGPDTGWAAAALFYTMPVVAINSAWAYVDLGLALFALLTVRALQGWWGSGDRRWIVLAGSMAGLSLGTKYTGGAVLVVGAVMILFRGLGRRRFSPRNILVSVTLFCALGVAAASPWLARNVLLRANPVYPFAASVFGAPEGDTYRAERHRAVLDRPEVPITSPGDVVLLPWRFTMEPWVRDEMIGPALLVTLPLLVLFPTAGGGWLLCVALGFGGVWSVLSPQVRLFVHGLGILSATAAIGWTRARGRGGGVGLVASAALVVAVLASVANLAVIQRGLSDPFPVVLGMESRAHYLERMVDGHRAIAFINRELPEDARVLFIGEIYGYYCERDYVLGSKFDRAPIVDWIVRSEDLPGFLQRLRDEGITHVLYSQVQLRKFATLPGQYLDWPDERSRGIYREFMTRWLTIVHEDPDAIVGRVGELETGPAAS